MTVKLVDQNWLEIDIVAIEQNLKLVRSRIADLPIMAVVKCNAYGHGSVKVAHILQDFGIHHFAVADEQEALHLRKCGIKGRILCMGYVKNYPELIRNHISLTVNTTNIGPLIVAVAEGGESAIVHLKVNTGLNRHGLDPEECFQVMAKLAAYHNIRIEGIYTTLSEESQFDSQQIKQFDQLCQNLQESGLDCGIRHVFSSAAVLSKKDPQFDMVRIGSSLLGFEKHSNLSLVPAMSLKSRVVALRQLQPGDTVGYHRRFRADQEMTIAILPIGYSSGLSPLLACQGEVLVGGQRCPIVSPIGTNHLCVDVTGINVTCGAEVVLFGTQDGAQIEICEVSSWSETHEYHVVTSMSPLLPRVYI